MYLFGVASRQIKQERRQLGLKKKIRIGLKNNPSSAINKVSPHAKSNRNDTISQVILTSFPIKKRQLSGNSHLFLY